MARELIAGECLEILRTGAGPDTEASLSRGRVMHYAIPESLKKDYGITSGVPRTHRWIPPAATV
jgi:hypothetical protein